MTTTPSFIEIGASDAATSAAFFSGLFGWKYTRLNEGGGWFQTPTIRIGLHGGDPTRQLYVYFAVADLDVAMAQVRAAGGHADAPMPEEPGFGRFCNCRDPGGIVFGLHQPPPAA